MESYLYRRWQELLASGELPYRWQDYLYMYAEVGERPSEDMELVIKNQRWSWESSKGVTGEDKKA